MACEVWRGQLDRYVDGELASAEARDVANHLRACAACAADVLQRVQIKRAVKTAGKRYEPSAELRRKITRIVETKLQRSAAKQWRSILAPVLILLVAAFWLNSYLGRKHEIEHRVYSELADLHVSTLASATPVDVLSSDRHTVKPWFQGKIPFTFNLPELPGSEFSLVGGRVAYLEQVAGAHLIYQIRKHEISVFIFPDREDALRELPTGAANAASFNLETWTKNGLRYFVMGDARAEDIRALSKLLRDAS